MDPLAKLVADRYARRTIQFDQRAIQLKGAELAEEAIRKIRKVGWPSRPIDEQFDPAEIFASGTLQVRSVLGEEKTLKVNVWGRPAGGHQPTAGGDFNKTYNIINLYLDTDWTPEALELAKNQVIRRFSSNLVHEVTHALDVFGDQYVGFGVDREKYYNQPVEFRAYSKQIITEALGAIPKLKRLKWRGKAPPLYKVVEDLLENSDTFKRMGQLFDRSNQNRLRQMLVREVQDLGLL